MRTRDRAVVSDVLTVQSLGRTQEKTPEGFLLCREVPIARVGEMLYGHGETPVPVGRDCVARITRDESTLFSSETMASFEGKPVTLDHPSEDVNPSNWRKLSVGVARDVRRGEGPTADMLVADLLIMDERAIRQVRDGLREVSCGYDAEYAWDAEAPGLGQQVKIVGNHIALVDRGRCGPVCSIGDSAMSSKKSGVSFRDRLKAKFFARDEAGFMEELEGAPDGDIPGDVGGDKQHTITINLNGEPAGTGKTVDEPVDPPAGDPPAGPDGAQNEALAQIMTALEGINARLTALEGGAAPDDADGDGIDDDVEARTTDSASLADEFQDTLARAEILSPGIQVPTYDSKMARAKTVDTICQLRRRALEHVADSHKEAVAPLLAGVDLKKAPCEVVRTAFVAASELARRSTNDSITINRGLLRDQKLAVPSIADINKRNAEGWAKRRA